MKNSYKILDKSSREISATSLNLHLKEKANYSSGFPMLLKTLILTLAIFVAGIGDFFGQAVSTYTPLITSGTYSAITGTSILGNVDDGSSLATNIGFTFNLGGQNFTQFVANSNGHIRLGATAATSNTVPLSTTSNTYSISAAGADGKSTGGVIHTVSGSAPNRVSIIQYTSYDLIYTATTPRVSFQIRLYETTNVVEIIYTGATGTTTTRSVQVGLRGSTTTADVRNYSGSNSGWATLTAGTTSTSTIPWGSSQNTLRSMPSNGRILRWSPPVVPACTGTPAPGNTITSSATVAPGGTVNLSLQNATTGTGLTYAWESGPSSTGPWTGFGTSSATQTSPAINANIWFRCRVICGANTGASNSVQVTLSYCTASGTGASSYISNFVTSGGVTNISNSSGFTAGGYANYSPTLSCSQSAGLGLNFTLNYVSDPGTKIFIDWNNDLDFNDAGENVYSSNAYVLSSVAGTITVPVGQAIGNYRMRIVVDWNSMIPTACPVSINGETEDYTFTVTAPPSCISPTALTSSAITSTTASISWTAASPAPASGYQYYYSTVNTAPTAGTTPSGSTAAGITSANLTGLTANTTYYFWVRSNCGGSGTSAWAGASNFFTGYCIPTGTAGYYITNVTTTSGATNIANTTASNAGYGNFTAQSASNYIGTGTNFSVGHTATLGGAGVGVWIDWNNDLDFADVNEQIGLTTGWNYSPFTGTINIPVGTPVGNYRMRIVIDYGATSPISCPVGITGETEDYTFTVIALVPCVGTPAPGNTLTSSASVAVGGTVNLSLSTPPTGTGLTYAWQSGPSNTGPWTTIATTATYTATLSATTWYQCIVTCAGVTGTSAPVQVTAVVANNIPLTGSSSVACGTSTLIYDNGGSAGNYGTSASGYIVLNNAVGSTSVITLSGTYSGIETCCDNFKIYSGSGIGGTLLYTYGAAGAGTIATFSSAAGQTITIQFNSDGSIEGAGIALNAVYSGSCAVPACSGTPAPGATTASTSQVFAGGSTTLGITTAQSGTGITYQWQSGASASGPWLSIGGATSATYVASPTAATYYQCIVTCSASGASGNSTPILISFNAYCLPAYTYGTVDGDLISNVVIAGTTLSNNTGTTAGLSSYNFYSGQLNYTANMVAANSYNVSVTAGSFTNQNFAAWIDYNDNNVFEASESIGFSSAATTVGFQTVTFTINLSCTPPLGQHRMRVRGVYAAAGSTIDPCSTYGWGETEDYLITIVSGTAFTPAFVSTPTSPNCVGTQVTYTATAGQTNYAWTFPGTAGVDYTLVSGGTSASNTAVVVYNNSGSKTVNMNYASPLGCASSGAVTNTITVNPLPTVLSLTGSSVCSGLGTITSSTSQSGVNYQLYNSSNTALGSVLAGTGSGLTWSSIAAGTGYYVAGTNATTSCNSSASNAVAITLNAAPSVTANASTSTTVCLGTTTTLTGGGASTYTWDNGVTNGVSFTPTATTTYTVTGTDVNGCVNTASTTVTVNTPTVTANVTAGTAVWRGATSVDFGTAANWYAYDGTNYSVSSTAPSASTNVIIPVNQGCVSQQPSTLTSSGSVNNITIEVGATLTMVNTTLIVGGNWVNNGTFVPGSGTVEFSGAANQTITRAAGETFNNLTINKSTGVVSLANNIAVNSTLNLTNGIIDLQASNLNLGSSNLVGGSDISYVKTSGAGTLNRNVSNSATIFPVGNIAFNPATLTNAGTTDDFSVRVYDYVSTTGVQGGAPTTGQVVNRTWMVSEGTVGGSNVSLRMQWNAGEEANGFVYNPGFMNVGHHNGAIWEELGALNQGSSPFFVEQTGINSFSPFIIATTGTVLPIELTSFQANCMGDDNVSVTWTTASEHNTSHFIVEKSRDGNNWTALGVVTAAGNSTSMINYSLADNNEGAGITYYRLAQYDNDGVFEIFNAVSTNCANITNALEVTVYPNPSNGEFFIDLFTEEIAGEAVVTITDSKGVIVKNLPVFVIKGSNTFHVNGLEAAPGMYYIQVSNGTSSSSIVKHSLR